MTAHAHPAPIRSVGDRSLAKSGTLSTGASFVNSIFRCWSNPVSPALATARSSRQLRIHSRRHERAAVVETVRVDAFAIPHGSSLRQALGHHGWRPTRAHVPGCGWGAILVEPIHRR